MNHKKNIWHQLSKPNEPLTLYMEQDKKKRIIENSLSFYYEYCSSQKKFVETV
jgi:hypothetical protein